jgi:hypothetical protein
MGLLSAIKAGVIRLADGLNKMHDPFDEFSRPIIRRTADTLATKATQFEEQMGAEFMLPNGVFNYRKVYDGEPLDLGDQCLWHGITTAAQAFKYSVTQNPTDCSRLRALLAASALHHYGPNLWLIRGITPDKTRYADDASNDSLTGHVAGLWWGWLYGDAGAQVIAASILKNTASELLSNKDSLMKQDGTPTTYGTLVDGWKTDPLRLTLALATYMAAYKMTRLPQFVERASTLYRAYHEIVGFPKVMLWTWEKDYDTHRAAIHLSILADTASGEMLERCQYGLKRIWDMKRKTADPWLMGLCARHGAVPDADLKAVSKRLHEYEFAERGPQVERLNSKDADYWKSQGVKFFDWGGKLRASQPLPFWKMGTQDFFPQRNMFSVDNWTGQTDARLKYSGLDFLASYWLARNIGAVTVND